MEMNYIMLNGASPQNVKYSELLMTYHYTETYEESLV
jgi:hypothetical protein